MKKQKTLIVHNFYKIPGGEDTVVYNEKRLLEDNGHDVVLYTRSNMELESMSKIKKICLPFTMIFSLKTYHEIKKIIKKEKIDIVHVHNTLTMISPSVYYAANSLGIPVVQTIHNFRLLCPGATFHRNGGICEDCVQHGLKNAIKNRCYRESKIQTLACVICTKIHRITKIYEKLNYICLTEFNKKKIVLLNQIKDEKVFIKPNFVHVDNTDFVKHIDRKNQIVYVGRLDKLKGIELLINAWSKYKIEDMKLIICGKGPMEEWCKEKIELNNMKSVELKGFVSNDEAKKIIGESKALILPTQWYEGFPMTIVEAYSVGTPVVGSDIGNVASVIIEGVTGLKFDHTSEFDLINKINRIKNMQLEQSVIQVFNEKYTVQKNYEQLKGIYDQVCNS